MMRLFSVLFAFVLMTSTLMHTDHLPRLQQKIDAENDAADETDESEATSDDEGSILNIRCWDNEFQRYFNEYYPDVKSVSKDRTTTTLRDGTTVKWRINSSLDNNYQNQLDKALMAQCRRRIKGIICSPVIMILSVYSQIMLISPGLEVWMRL